MFQPSSANIRIELCRLYSMFGVMTPRGKTYRYSPLCSQQAVDSVSENDKEVEQSLSQSQRESRKRGAHGEDDCAPQNKRLETSVSATESTNVIDKFYMVSFRF